MARILNECSFLSPEGIAKVEQMKNCKYVCESPLIGANRVWSTFPAAIFYTEEAHPQGSHYMGLYFDGDHFYVTDGGPSVTDDWSGLQVGEEVIYSRYRHDYRTLGEAFIDGGKDYTRWGGGTPVTLRVVKDQLVVVDDA